MCKAIDEDVKYMRFKERLWLVQTVKIVYLRITSDAT